MSCFLYAHASIEPFHIFSLVCVESLLRLFLPIYKKDQKRVSIIASNYEQQTLDEIQSFRSSHLNDHIVAPLHNTIKKLFSRFVHLVLQGGFWLLSSQQLQLKHETWLKGCFPSLHTRRISAPSPMIITFHICQSVQYKIIIQLPICINIFQSILWQLEN